MIATAAAVRIPAPFPGWITARGLDPYTADGLFSVERAGAKRAVVYRGGDRREVIAVRGSQRDAKCYVESRYLRWR